MLTDSLKDTIAFMRKEARMRAYAWGQRVGARRGSANDRPRRPVFIVGCPRSGTTLLFELLAQHSDFRALPGEGHVIWNAYQHPRRKSWSSDRATAADVTPSERTFVYGAIRHVAGGYRYLDKTPKNVLKLPYLVSLFPDAQFVFIKRDGRATVNSLIEGWSLRKGISYRLPEPLRLAEYQGRFWSYVLPSGWREVRRSTIAHVAAAQYVASNETAIGDIASLSGGSVIEVSYEDLVSRPIDTSARLLELLELRGSTEVLEFASHLDQHVSGALSTPRQDKWRDRVDQIERVLPIIGPTVKHLGYETEVVP
jgi:hypothetical protein